LKILYFAWLRERLNRGEDNVAPPATVKTVADLIAWLTLNDESIALALANPKIVRVAVDGRIVDPDASVDDARVVALIPPMTGG
jgi:molybdopterin synthase sulfur carrier subunit